MELFIARIVDTAHYFKVVEDAELTANAAREVGEEATRAAEELQRAADEAWLKVRGAKCFFTSNLRLLFYRIFAPSIIFVCPKYQYGIVERGIKSV